MLETQDNPRAASGTTSIAAVVLAHRFIVRSRKSRAKENILETHPGVERGLNMRQAILEREKEKEYNRNVMAGRKSKNWQMLKDKITSAKITEALNTLKFVVNGNTYTALRPLGEGGYSQVYEVYNSQKDIFALKVVDLGVQSSKVKKDLIREIVFLERLKQCEHVVRAYEYELLEGDQERMLVLMERGERDLQQVLALHRTKGTLTPARLRSQALNLNMSPRFYWEQMLLSVQDLHRANIIHADIKPGNFLSVGGELKVIDFGLACEMAPGQDHFIRNFVSGTAAYISPEVLNSDRLTKIFLLKQQI